MEKHLVPFGNSLGLVIDRPIRDLLHLTRDTPLRISTDGQRIIIEPLAPRPAPTKKLDARRILDELVVIGGGPSQELHEKLHPGIGPRAVLKCLAWADFLSNPLSADDQRQLDRYRVVLERRRAGDRWEAAIEAALAQHPSPKAA